jgi:hypothetical protein
VVLVLMCVCPTFAAQEGAKVQFEFHGQVVRQNGTLVKSQAVGPCLGLGFGFDRVVSARPRDHARALLCRHGQTRPAARF